MKDEIEEETAYGKLFGQRDALLILLLAAGYLKFSGFEGTDELVYDAELERILRPVYKLTLTNLEVQEMFTNMVKGWFQTSAPNYNRFVQSLLLGDEDAMNEYMNRVALATFSFFDTGGQPAREDPERFYHGFVLGLMVELADRYTLTSNRESGFGRYDVMLEPRNPQDDAFILEFKVFRPKRGNSLEDTVAAALSQIEEKQYQAKLIQKGIEESRIRKYGFAFRGKEVLIGS